MNKKVKMTIKIIMLLICSVLLIMYISNCISGVKTQQYLNTAKKFLQNEGKVSMGKIFNDFSWDFAYVIKENYEGGKILDKNSGNYLEIPSVETDTCRRIVFVNNGNVTYIHYRSIEELFILNEGIIVTPESILSLVQGDESKNIIYAKFEEVNEHHYYELIN